MDVGPARPYQEHLPEGMGGVLAAGATGGAQSKDSKERADGKQEEPDLSYLPNAKHWMAGPLKKQGGDHYRQGFGSQATAHASRCSKSKLFLHTG